MHHICKHLLLLLPRRTRHAHTATAWCSHIVPSIHSVCARVQSHLIIHPSLLSSLSHLSTFRRTLLTLCISYAPLQPLFLLCRRQLQSVQQVVDSERLVHQVIHASPANRIRKKGMGMVQSRRQCVSNCFRKDWVVSILRQAVMRSPNPLLLKAITYLVGLDAWSSWSMDW